MKDRFLDSEQETQYRILTGELRDARTRTDAHARATHDRFNVFTCLLKENDEVRLHTRFLHCLLDPNGAHDCGDLFLNLFFRTLQELKVGYFDDEKLPVFFKLAPTKRNWKVHKEMRCGSFGQLDLLIESYDVGIAIDNKIHANEQDRQLASYSEYLRTAFPKESHLIYLTIDGKDSISADNHKYLRISYSHHILHWLEECLRATYQFIPINQALLQYRKVIHKITHQDIDPKFMEPAVNVIKRNPDIIRLNGEIQCAIEITTKEVWKNLRDEIISSLGDKYYIETNANFPQNSTGIIFRQMQNNPIEIWVERDEKCLGIGVCTDRVPVSEEQTMKLYEEIRNGAYEFKLSEPVMPRYPTGWHNLLVGTPEEQTADILDKANRDKLLTEIQKYLYIASRVHCENE